MPRDLYDYLEAGGREAAQVENMIPDSFVGKLAIAGTVDECGEQLASLLEAGIDHPLLAPIPVEPGGELEILRQVADHILPDLRRVVAHG